MPALMFGSWVLNEIWVIDLSPALIGVLMSSSKLFLFSKGVHLNSGVRQLLELYCIVLIKHVAFITIWPNSKVAFTCTSLPLNLYTSVFRCGCGFGFEQKFCGSTNLEKKKHGSADLEKKKHGSADLHTPIQPPLLLAFCVVTYLLHVTCCYLFQTRKEPCQ